MCGITGGIGIDPRALESMTRALRHRGPDQSGYETFEERVGIGATRLAIMDPSHAGDQPMSNTDGSIWIAFNGEVYNHPSLRSEMKADGIDFRSGCDTEVVLKQYERDGIDCVERLEGMFAFAILDRKRRKLFLARDPFGIKPLYYCSTGGKFVFGSEIKSILRSGAYSPDIDWQAISDFFTFSFVPGPRTAFAGINQLAPGRYIEVGLDDVHASEHPYRAGGSEGRRTVEQIPQLLRNSVRSQMLSDVPLGAFLSGGIDSSLLVALMAEASAQPIKTFTVTFTGPGLEYFDESKRARYVSNVFGTEHHELPVALGSPADALELLRHFDQPFANPTFLLMHSLSEVARREVKVALAGVGGDELFGGYPRYKAWRIAHHARFVPSGVTLGAARALSPLRDSFKTPLLRRMRKYLSAQGDLLDRYAAWTYFLSEDAKRKLLIKPLGDRPSSRILKDQFDASRSTDPGNKLLEADMKTFLVDNVLEYTDKMSMAVGLEVRVPYLTTELVDACLSVPFAEKVQLTTTKNLVRKLFRGVLPDDVWSAPKRGFNMPLARWLEDGLSAYLDANLSRSHVDRGGIFKWDSIRRLRQQHEAGARDNSQELFSIVTFDSWYQTYILQDRSAE